MTEGTHEKTRRILNVTVLVDAAATVATFLLAFRIRDAFLVSEADFLSHLALLPFVLSIWYFFLSRFGAYRSPRECGRIDSLWTVVRAVGAGLGVLLVLLFLLKIQYVSRAVVAMFAAMNVFALAAVRLVIARYFWKSMQDGASHLKVLIIGTGNRARRVSRELRSNPGWGVTVVGHLDLDRALVGTPVGRSSKVLGVVEDIEEILKNNVVDEVILAVPRAMLSDVEKIASACEEEGVRFRILADVFNVSVARIELVEFGGLPLLTLYPVAQEEWKLIVKRIVDLAITMLFLPPVLILTALIAAAIRIDSRGPVFFIQERVGMNKRRFPMYKFRTMFTGSEKMQKELDEKNEAEGPIFKIANDPRITRVGKFLRRMSLDELPQVFNVVRGEMSLVGPRPMSVRDVDLFDRGIQRKRFSVKPGITCLWQVSGRSLLPFSKWLELDLLYISNWSLGLDFKILLKTIPAVLRGTGAM